MDTNALIIYTVLTVMNLVIISAVLHKRFWLKQKISYKDFSFIF